MAAPDEYHLPPGGERILMGRRGHGLERDTSLMSAGAVVRLAVLCTVLLAPSGCDWGPSRNQLEAWRGCVREVNLRVGRGARTRHPPVRSDSVSMDYGNGAFRVSSSVVVRRWPGRARSLRYTCRIRQRPDGQWLPAEVTFRP